MAHVYVRDALAHADAVIADPLVLVLSGEPAADAALHVLEREAHHGLEVRLHLGDAHRVAFEDRPRDERLFQEHAARNRPLDKVGKRVVNGDAVLSASCVTPVCDKEAPAAVFAYHDRRSRDSRNQSATLTATWGCVS